ncbi:UNVERIFIED_CONTAM: hypothetical protein Slati_4218500 [Sesamum latifolium]|uniref:DDE Tnp4 domain-containing protein n=1 Tax=Sesamum latifolium TaxID=2727402 RepID=A0AAW2TAE7_9LAMI
MFSNSTTIGYLASSGVRGGIESNSASESPRTPGTPGSNESDVPEEYYAFRDLICPELFRKNVSRNTSALQGAGWVAEIMTTPHQGRFFDNIRMTKQCFYALVDALTSRGLLLTVSHPGLHQSRRFHRVLSAFCAMAPELITPPNFAEPHPRVANNPDFYPFFKDCVGAMDGMLVPVWVPPVDQNRYQSRKGRVAHNVLVICDFDMNFTYVYAGWEGSAADARVLDNAVSKDPNFPFPPIDAGFANYHCFLAPYRGTRYHLPEWRGPGRRYRSPQDMFNHAHLRLRNIIERCFGVLEKYFSILQWGMPSYLQHHQVDLLIACCTLHNFIRRFSNDDIIFNEPDEDTPVDMNSFYHRGHPTTIEIEAQRTLRDSIAVQIWAAYHPN